MRRIDRRLALLLNVEAEARPAEHIKLFLRHIDRHLLRADGLHRQLVDVDAAGFFEELFGNLVPLDHLERRFVLVVAHMQVIDFDLPKQDGQALGGGLLLAGGVPQLP